MIPLFVAIFGAIPVIGPIIKLWADRWAQANRPDIIQAQEAQVQQTSRDQTATEIATAMNKHDPAAAQKALDALRQEAAE